MVFIGMLLEQSTVQTVSKESGIPAISIAKLDDLFGYLLSKAGDPALAEFKNKVEA